MFRLLSQPSSVGFRRNLVVPVPSEIDSLSPESGDLLADPRILSSETSLNSKLVSFEISNYPIRGTCSIRQKPESDHSIEITLHSIKYQRSRWTWAWINEPKK